MRINDELAAIGGEATYDFETHIGQGCAVVLVRMAYEFDSSGIHDYWIESVRTMARLDITGYLEESTLDDLAMLGCKLLNDSFTIED
jgi:hypothetical protein